MRLIKLTIWYIILSSFTSIKTPKQNIYNQLQGTWESELNIGSENYNPHTISFNKDYSKIIFNTIKPIEISKDNFVTQYEYLILKTKKDKLKLSLIGETRTSKDGKLVWWDLILINKNTYVWKRNDWEAAYTLNPIKRIIN